jgi:hypothetical protein
MRLPIFLLFVLLACLLGATGCEKCWCCGGAAGSVICTKDSTYLDVPFYPNGTVQRLLANAQDTFNYYTAKGYTCTQSIGPDPSHLHRVCGPLHKLNTENGGEACSSDPSLDCEP